MDYPDQQRINLLYLLYGINRFLSTEFCIQKHIFIKFFIIKYNNLYQSQTYRQYMQIEGGKFMNNIQVASLTDDQIDAINKYESDFIQKFGNKIVLVALNKNK